MKKEKVKLGKILPILSVFAFILIFTGYHVSAQNQERDRDRTQTRIQDQTNCNTECLQERAREREQKMIQIMNESKIISSGKPDEILSEIDSQIRNRERERNMYELHTQHLMQNAYNYQNRERVASSTNLFIAYGTKKTNELGAGERAGVLNSYMRAFGRLPESENDWEDIIKIACGNWPVATNTQAEIRARENFRYVYRREANINNPHDNAALTLMAYGLRPENRNLNSEKNALSIFTRIYGHAPKSSEEWDILRAIAYSGATR